MASPVEIGPATAQNPRPVTALNFAQAERDAGSSQASLSVDFAATAPEQWYVNSWEWSRY